MHKFSERFLEDFHCWKAFKHATYRVVHNNSASNASVHFNHTRGAKATVTQYMQTRGCINIVVDLSWTALTCLNALTAFEGHCYKLFFQGDFTFSSCCYGCLDLPWVFFHSLKQAWVLQIRSLTSWRQVSITLLQNSVAPYMNLGIVPSSWRKVFRSESPDERVLSHDAQNIESWFKGNCRIIYGITQKVCVIATTMTKHTYIDPPYLLCEIATWSSLARHRKWPLTSLKIINRYCQFKTGYKLAFD